MFKKTTALLLALFMGTLATVSTAARAQSVNDTAAIDKTRAKVNKIGAGHHARIEVKLRDSSHLKGYVNAINSDSFTVTDAKTGADRTVTYAEVSEVKKSGGGLSTRTWIIIAGAATAATIVGFTVIKPVLCDGGAGC